MNTQPKMEFDSKEVVTKVIGATEKEVKESAQFLKFGRRVVRWLNSKRVDFLGASLLVATITFILEKLGFETYDFAPWLEHFILGGF